MQMKPALNRSVWILVIALLYSGIARGGVDGHVYWFSSTTSNLLNRSSVELASDHVERGIYFAHKALEKNLSQADSLIANHNLCIGYLFLDNASKATHFCARAFFLTLGTYQVVNKHGVLFLDASANGNVEPALTPLQVLVSNMQRQSPDESLAGLVE